MRGLAKVALIGLPLLLSSIGWAEEAADRGQIDKTIAALNVTPEPSGLYTDDSVSELGKLPQPGKTQGRLQLNSVVQTQQALGAPTAQPTVVISHEPWGEARINLGGAELTPPAMEMLNPHISSGTIRFVSADVATVDGKWTYTDGGSIRTIPLLFVMRREGDEWKIASARLLAPQ